MQNNDIYKSFVWRLINNNIGCFQNKNTSNFFAFSLIELSIVLIIIGLLVAGITGGASLVRSAKVRAFMNELNGYKQAVSAFYASKGRLPGDLNNLGTMGEGSEQTYTTSSFPAPYNTIVPNGFSAPFIDMYLEKVIDFKPIAQQIGSSSYYKSPYSKIYQNSGYSFYNIKSSNATSSYYLYAPKLNSPYLRLLLWSGDKTKFSDFKAVDQKMDDGIYNSGSFRTSCSISGKNSGYTSYDSVINDNTKKGECTAIFYNIGF